MPSFLNSFLTIVSHPFVPQAVLMLFILTQTITCVKAHINNAWLYRVSCTLLCLLFVYAAYAHLAVDVRYFYVMYNNHPAQSLHYRIASLWSHHETSLFIWFVTLNLTTYMLPLSTDITYFRRRILGLLNCLICCYLMVEANPFAITPIEQLNQQSQGLNPLLYDINMVWHPPLLYLGVTFLFTPYVLGLWYYRIGDHSVLLMLQRQTKIAFGFLTLAIALGSFWAFTQLGWGGFWFWDPVETASLLPWVSALIVFHLNPGALKKYPWIASVPFSFVMISLWAVRSGMLMSVHSFANDIMAFWVLGALAFFTSIPLLMIFLVQKKSTYVPKINFYLKCGLWLLTFSLMLLIIGLFVPVIFDVTLSITFFNTTLLPIWIMIAIFMAIAPYKNFVFGTSTTMALLTLMLFILFYSDLGISYMLLGSGGAISFGAMLPLLRTKPAVALAHMGVGLCLIGLASHSNSPPESTLTLTRGQLSTHNNCNFTFIDTTERIEPFVTYQEARVELTLPNATSKLVSPQTLTLIPARQFFHSSQLQRVKASFGFFNQRIIMISNIEFLPDGHIAVTIHEKFGLLWLVLGCAMIVITLLIFPIQKYFDKNRRLRILNADNRVSGPKTVHVYKMFA